MILNNKGYLIPEDSEEARKIIETRKKEIGISNSGLNTCHPKSFAEILIASLCIASEIPKVDKLK